VVLAGDGADEIFGGYARYTAWRWLQNIHTGIPFPEMPEGLGRHTRWQNIQRKLARITSLARLPRADRYRRMCAFHDRSWVKTLLSENIPVYTPALDFHSVRTIHHVLQMDFQFLLPGNMLPKSDVSAMANSVEVRLPWLDEDLTAWMRGMPTSALRNKQVLHAAWQHFVGKPFVNPKKGLDVPIERMMASGPMYAYWMDISGSARVRDSGYFNPSTLDRLRNSKGDAELKWTLLTWMQVVGRFE
jgi:asparagine synthetase B (glutamine-hydrolysing)